MPLMPGRVSADHATFRDLTIFEERLKDTAASLQRRKSRYQLFLAHLLALILLLLIDVFLPPNTSLVAVPYNLLLRWLLPHIHYPLDSPPAILHPYVTTGLLFVSITTLVLFFASGMYSEKIAYANKYVPHANRSLRSFNMYFNTRKPSLRSQFYWNPLAFFFPRPEEHNHHRHPSRSPSRSPPTPSTPIRDPSSRPIPSIPPATNPRGELIFSSRIDKAFREGYERYRAAFEKKRQESIRDRQKNPVYWEWLSSRLWRTPPAAATTTTPTPPPTPMRVPSGSASRGRRGSTTGGAAGLASRSSTPTPNTTERSGSPMRQSSRSGRRSPNRRSGAAAAGMDLVDQSDMRVQALERSLAQGSVA